MISQSTKSPGVWAQGIKKQNSLQLSALSGLHRPHVRCSNPHVRTGEARTSNKKAEAKENGADKLEDKGSDAPEEKKDGDAKETKPEEKTEDKKEEKKDEKTEEKKGSLAQSDAELFHSLV